jgi:hypothetical protein
MLSTNHYCTYSDWLNRRTSYGVTTLDVWPLVAKAPAVVCFVALAVAVISWIALALALLWSDEVAPALL